LVNLSSANFDYSKAKSDGSDLRFIDADNSAVLNYEIEDWETSGYSYIWVNVTNISASSSMDHIWIYYNNSGASPGENPTGVWNDNYKGVYHFGEGSGAMVEDSTANGNDGTLSQTDHWVTTGKMANAYDFDGVDDYVDLGLGLGTASYTEITVEAWFKADETETTLVTKIDDDGWDEGWSLGAVVVANNLGFWVDDETDAAITSFTDTTSFHFATGTYDSSSDQKIYVDGDWKVTEPDDWTNHGTASVLIGAGRDNGGPAYFNDGIIDEVRISNISRSADWIAAQYLSMSNSFVAFGQQESYKSNCGAAHLFLGHQGLNLSNINASNANVTFIGAEAGDLFGWDVAGIGDFNADGYDDIAVGAPGSDFNGTDSGAAYVFLGRSVVGGPIQVGTAMADFLVNVSSPGDKAGFSVAGLGDVNGDGYADLGVGGPLNDTSDGSTSDAGCAWVFYGFNTTDDSPQKLQVGESFLKTSVSGQGTGNTWAAAQTYLNNDVVLTKVDLFMRRFNGPGGFNAIVEIRTTNSSTPPGPTSTVLASTTRPFSDIPAAYTWQTFDFQDIMLIPGQKYAIVLRDDTSDPLISLGWQFYNPDEYSQGDRFTAPDDGVTWSIPPTVGDHGFKTYTNVSILDDANVTIDGDQVNAQLGFSLSGAGDVNNDGNDDILVGVPFNDTGGSPDAGAAHIFCGAHTLPSTMTGQNADVNLSGAVAQDRFGWSVNATGRINGDAFDDVIVGAPGQSSNPGMAYVYYGANQMDNIEDVTLTGTSSGDNFGHSVCGGFDIDEDGSMDVAIGAPYVDQNGNTDCGAVYVFYGEGLSSTDAASANHSYYGEQGYAHLGWSVSPLGDVNGDGQWEVLCGAPDHDDTILEPDVNGTGIVYILTIDDIVVPEFNSFFIISMVMATTVFFSLTRRRKKEDLTGER